MSVLSFQPDNKPRGAVQPAAGQHFVDVGRRLLQHDGHPDRARPRVHAGGRDARIRASSSSTRRWRGASSRTRIRSVTASRSGRTSRAIQQWVEIVGVVGNVRQYRADQEPVPITYAPNSGAPSRAQNLMIRTTGDPMSVAGLGPRRPAVARSVAAGVAAAHARRRGRRIADAAPLQHDAADRVRRHRVDPGDRRHLRHGGLLGGAAHAGDRHPGRARRHQPRDSRAGAVRIAQAGGGRPRDRRGRGAGR